MSHPVHLPPALLADIDAALSTMPAGMTRAAIMRRLLRAGLLVEGRALTEDRAAVVPREWPAAGGVRCASCCSGCLGLDEGPDWQLCTIENGRAISDVERHGTTPPDWCPLRAGPVVLRLEVSK